MPCQHYKIKISKRSRGQSAVAQAAYQSGERLFDERSNRTKYYSDKRGIIYTEIMLPVNAPPEYANLIILEKGIANLVMTDSERRIEAILKRYKFKKDARDKINTLRAHRGLEPIQFKTTQA